MTELCVELLLLLSRGAGGPSTCGGCFVHVSLPLSPSFSSSECFVSSALEKFFVRSAATHRNILRLPRLIKLTTIHLKNLRQLRDVPLRCRSLQTRVNRIAVLRNAGLCLSSHQCCAVCTFFFDTD